jgi:hypothetical protein
MLPLVHGLLAWFLAVVILKNVNDRRLVIVAGVAPDLDGIFMLFNQDLYYQFHHTFAHSYVFGIMMALTAGVLGIKKKKVFIVAVGTFSLHLITDIIGATWAVYPLYPFSNLGLTIGIYLSYDVIYQFINPPVLLLSLVTVICVAYFKEFSPVEFISEKLDKTIVGYYVNPIKYKCNKCGKRAFIECFECGKKFCTIHSRSIIKSKCKNCF